MTAGPGGWGAGSPPCAGGSGGSPPRASRARGFLRFGHAPPIHRGQSPVVLSMRSKYVLWGLRIAGAGLLAASAAIHLDLFLTGYRSIPTIGWLFLLQVITAFALALAVLIVPLIPASRLPASVPAAAVDAGVAAAGAGFAL